MPRLPLAVLTALAALVLAAPAGAVVAPSAERPLRNVDVRAADGGPVTATERRGRAALRRALGDEGVVSGDRISGGARLVARTDGFLTGGRSGPAADVALDYVRARPAVFGLDAGDLAALRLDSRDRSADGVTHLAYTQTYRGVGAYDNVLLANVAADGRLLNVGGAAVSGLSVASVTPRLDAMAALATAKQEVAGALLPPPRAQRAAGPEQATRFSNGDAARLTLFDDGAKTRLAWRLEVAGEHDFVYELVVDALSGAVLKRRSLTEFAAADVYRNHPGATTGGTPESVDLATVPAWLNQSAGSTKLSGNNAHAYADEDAIDGPSPSEEVPSSSGHWDYPLVTSWPGCPAPGCTWLSTTPVTRGENREQAATQLFYLVNTFHDHLESAPIGFTHAARNFEVVDADAAGPGLGGDPVLAESDNYLNAGTNNASMTTRPDGTSPRLEMLLFTNPSLNSAHTADVVYHEYAHGLTNRSVGSGVGLDTNQARAMGEGWSDWYALDYLAGAALVADAPGIHGELNLGGYLLDLFGTGGFRRQGIDCPVGAPALACPGAPGAGPGGFTLGDMGHIAGGFEVHDDGEIWVETLWDLRTALGVSNARRLITSGLRLAPNNPSFLEARDAIILADQAAGGANYDALWSVFAARGMGYRASTTSSAATTATENFDLPPRLVHDASTVSDPAPGADGDDVPEAGETISLSERLHNAHASDTTGITGVLGASTPGVTVAQPIGTWAPIPAGLSAANAAPLRVTLPTSASCGSIAQLSLAMTTTSPPSTFDIPLRIAVGSKPSVDAPQAIAAAGVDSTITFAGPGPVDDLQVRIAKLAHTYVGDLVVSLTSPAGTTVTLMNRPGSGTDGARGEDFVDLVLADDAATPIDAIPHDSPVGGYTGRFRPDQPLSAFDGEPRQGAWTLTVADAYASEDSGTLYDWGITPVGCPPVATPAPPPPPPPPPAPPRPPPPVLAPPLAPAPPPPPAPTPPAFAKLAVLRAGVSNGRLDVLASITARATGNVRVRYRSAGRTTAFDAAIADGRIRLSKALPRAQRSKPTGIITLTYAGTPAVLADSVTLRAATGKADLVSRTTRIDGRGRLIVAGTIAARARGVVLIRLAYATAGGEIAFVTHRAKIARGAWSLAAPLPSQAVRAGGQLSIQFTGYEPRLIRGEQLAKAISH